MAYSATARFWAKRISFDVERLDEVPSKWREEVRSYIESLDK